MRLALFPVPVLLLPGGKTRLKVIAPRSLRLVSEAMSESLGFALCLKTKNNIFFKIATRVFIYDFNQSSDGFLIIDIEAQEQVMLGQISADKEGLYHADVKPFINSSKPQLQAVNSDKFALASKTLKALLLSHPLYQNNIDQLPLENMTWVCRRWLELLPLDINEKYWLANSQSIADNLNFVCKFIARK